MDFDFYDQYRNYSTTDLLRIINQADQYQKEAVEAAQKVLGERTVTAEDMVLMERGEEEERQRMAGAGGLQPYAEKFREVVGPVATGRPLSPSRWFNLFLVVYGIGYAVGLYQFVHDQMIFLKCETCKGDYNLWAGFIRILFSTVLFLLLFKNRRVAWMLLVVGAISAVFTNTMQLFVLYKYRAVLHVSPVYTILNFIFPIAFALFVLKPSIITFFGLSEGAKRKTVWAGIIVGILYCGVVKFLL